MLVDNTPVEIHRIGDVPIHVKREDLCAPFPGPSFSKMRGVVAHIKARPEPVIGVLDTLHSKAGWCVSYVCSKLGKKCVNYWPKYKADSFKSGNSIYPRTQQQQSALLGATMVDFPAGRSAILYHSAKRHLRENFGADGYLMPNALKLPESITENAAEAYRTAVSWDPSGAWSYELPERGALVISISSGTVAAGVLKGLSRAVEDAFGESLFDRFRVYLHMGYSRSYDTVADYITNKSGLPQLSFDINAGGMGLVDEGYGYADAVRRNLAPFPCNPYYDGKAWAWLCSQAHARDTGWTNARELQSNHGDIIFWNIGA